MRMNLTTLMLAAALSLTAVPAMADMGGSMSAPTPSTMATTAGYAFELAGKPQSTNGTSVVSVQLMHNGKPVVGAIIIESHADMSPEGMGTMTAPIKALPTTTPGTYRFEVQNGSVWKKPGKWALTFSAKVQGEADTVHGSVVVELGT